MICIAFARYSRRLSNWEETCSIYSDRYVVWVRVLADIETLKRKLRDRSTKSAHGIDHISYVQIQSIPNDALLKLFNYCISNRTAPQNWFTTILLGILKPGKPADDPESYRLVGLECCLLKCLTLLIDMRIRAWVETFNVLPDSQNGFREKYRTHNNSFILRCAINKSRALNKPLYVAFVDLTNAFPATDLPTLWMKLYAAGVSGPLFDWLRMLYARMSYVVKQGSDVTAAFKSLIGVLTGDTASPILWNVYFADLAAVFGDDADDITLDGVAVSHLEQADDVVLFSTTPAGLQRKIDSFFAWCKVNFMVVSTSKTQWMIFGEIPRHIPIMRVGDMIISLVNQYKFVGVYFTSTSRDIFSAHYLEKASKARAVANMTFAVKDMIGCLPPPQGVQLYMARIDPHLTFGCEVALDVTQAHFSKLDDVQNEFLRRLLGLNKHSVLAVLFSETGITPLRYRRLSLAIGYLAHLMSLPPNHLAGVAFRDSCQIARDGLPCWLSDLHYALSNLPVPVLLSMTSLNPEGITDLKRRLTASCSNWIGEQISSMSGRLPLIQGRVERTADGSFEATSMKMRLYLRVPVPAHRKALTRILLSSHCLGIELLRYQERLKPPVPRHARLCRFCLLHVESESHALLGCSAPALVALRHRFFIDVYSTLPTMPRRWPSMDVLLQYLIGTSNFDIIQRLAKYAYDVLAHFSTTPVFRPAGYTYSTLG